MTSQSTITPTSGRFPATSPHPPPQPECIDGHPEHTHAPSELFLRRQLGFLPLAHPRRPKAFALARDGPERGPRGRGTQRRTWQRRESRRPPGALRPGRLACCEELRTLGCGLYSIDLCILCINTYTRRYTCMYCMYVQFIFLLYKLLGLSPRTFGRVRGLNWIGGLQVPFYIYTF